MEERNAHAPPPSLVPRLHSIIHLKLKHNNPNVPTEKAKLNSGRDNNIDVSILEHRRFFYFSFLLIRLWTYIYPLFIKILMCILIIFKKFFAYDADVSSLRTEISMLRRQILSALEQVMLGDSLAAEYFLCHLISSV